TQDAASWDRRRGWASCRAWRCSCACLASTCWATACATCSTRTCASDMADPRPRRRADRPPTLTIAGLSVQFATRRGVARVVDNASLEVWPGEIVGLIGESGSGKTLTALSVLGLLPRQARISGGAIRLHGE